MNKSSTLIFVAIIVCFALICAFLFYKLNEVSEKNKNLRLSLQKYRTEIENNIISEEDYQDKNHQVIKYQIALTKFAELSLICLDIDKIMQEATAIIANTLDVEFSQILHLLPNGSAFLLIAGVGWKENLIGVARLQATKNEASYTLATQKPVIMEDLFIETRFQVSPLLHNHKIISGVSIPIPIKEKIYGILGVYTTEKRLFSNDEINFLENIITIISAAKERHKEQEKFELLERAINSSTNGIIITDGSDSRNPIIYINSGFERITGYNKEEILGKNCSILQKDDVHQPQIREIKQGLFEGREIQTILRNYRKDGTMFWNQLHIAPVYDKDETLTNFIGVQTDISEQFSIELALKEKTQTLEKFTESLKLINNISVKNYQKIEDIFTEYLTIGCQILEMETGIISEVIGDNYIIQASHSEKFDFLIPGSEYDLKNTLCFQVIKQKKTISYANISNILSLSQHPFYINLKLQSFLATPIWINGQIYGTLNFFSTIPKKEIPPYQYELIELIAEGIGKVINFDEMELEKKQIDIALQESQERLDSILISLEDVVWSIHLDTLQLLYINPAVERIYEHNLSHFFHQKCFWLELIHPQDRSWVKECYSNLLNISLLSNLTNKNQDLEYRILMPNGVEKFVRDRTHIVYNDQGNPIRVDGIITDITKQKKAQIELQKSEEQFRLIFQLAPIGMIITTLDGYIEEVNNALCESLKYKKQELIGGNYDSFSHPEDLNYDLILKQKILTGEINEYEREKRYLAKDGTIVYTILKVTVLKDSQGKLTQIIKQIVDISQRKKAEIKLEHNALHDELTGLANRVLFIELLSQALSRCQRNPEELCAILFLDLDQFKRTNESLGHKIGDELLVNISYKIKSCLHKNDTLARLGGDEFAILLDDLKSQSEAIEIAEKILAICRLPLAINDHEIFTSITIGIAFSSIGYDKPEDMLRDADLTMYQAKDMGRNCYRIFDKTMYSQLLKRVQLESLLRKGIEAEEFILYYQPIVSFATRKLVGFEALIRWQNPELGFVSPANFIPMAEETGLIIPLGEWVLLEAAKQAVIWENMFPNLSLTISVNLSGKQLIEPSLLEKIDLILEKTKVNPFGLKLEVTETILMNNFDYTRQLLKEIQNRNLKISLDDFGTGYSSLSYLHRLPIDTLKIDRSFIIPLEKHPEKSAIIKTIVNLAHNLSLDVIAEGIETEHQVQVMQSIDCDYGQGYLFSKPVNSQQAESLIKQGYFPIL